MSIDMSRVDHLVEIQGMYDRWSIAVMKDGEVVNRWLDVPGYEDRAQKVQEYIDNADVV